MMANMLIPDEGKLLWLYWALCTDGSDLEDFTLRLYKNNFTPDDNTVLADFTEATFGGYGAVGIARASMGTPTIVSHVAESTRSSAPVFTCTSGSSQTVYGWYLESNTTNKCVATQAFDTPRVMSPGATESIDPFKMDLKTFA